MLKIDPVGGSKAFQILILAEFIAGGEIRAIFNVLVFKDI